MGLAVMNTDILVNILPVVQTDGLPGIFKFQQNIGCIDLFFLDHSLTLIVPKDLKALQILPQVGLGAKHIHHVHTFRMQIQLQSAKFMLINTKQSLAQIAVACGFTDESHLIRAFRKEYGITPGTFRKEHKNDPRWTK